MAKKTPEDSGKARARPVKPAVPDDARIARKNPKPSHKKKSGKSKAPAAAGAAAPPSPPKAAESSLQLAAAAAIAGATSKPRPYPGVLIVVEGIDGSGKSTQLYLLKRWLEIRGYKTHFTEWNSSPLVKSATKRGKRLRMLTPETFSLTHAADFADRWERQIGPLLQAGYIVLADRYIYTAFARDGARGCPHNWLRNLYSFAPIPDITFFFRAPLEVCLDRILIGRPKLKYYEAGLDMGLSIDPVESFRQFQGRILDEYDRMAETYQFVRMDALIKVNTLQKQVREIVQERIPLNRFKLKR